MEPVSMILTLGVAACFYTSSPRWSDEIEVAEKSAVTYLPNDSEILFEENIFEENSEIYNLVDINIYQDFAKSEIYEEIEKYKNLPRDWNGEGAESPAPKSVDSAYKFAKKLNLDKLPLPRSMVSCEGFVEFYWSFGDFYADLSFDKEGKSSFYLNDGEIEFFQDQLDLNDGLFNLIETYLSKMDFLQKNYA